MININKIIKLAEEDPFGKKICISGRAKDSEILFDASLHLCSQSHISEWGEKVVHDAQDQLCDLDKDFIENYFPELIIRSRI